MLEEINRYFLMCLSCGVVLLRLPALRSPQQRPIWFTLFFQGFGSVIQIPAVAAALNSAIGIPKVVSLISGINSVIVVTAILTFAIRLDKADKPDLAPWRRPRLIYAVLTVVTMAAAFLTALAHSTPARDRFLPAVGTFTPLTVYWIAYLLCITVASAWATVLFWRQLPKLQTKTLRYAVLMLAVASSDMLVYTASRTGAVLSTNPVFINVGSFTSSVYFILVTVGCSVSVTAPLIRKIGVWRDCNRLYSLWKPLCEAEPKISLEGSRSRISDLLSIQNIDFRHHRRIVEIRDGLLVLREWISTPLLARIESELTRENVGGLDAKAAVTACWLQVALHRHDKGFEREEVPLDLVGDGGADADAELRWLRKVAKANRSAAVRRCAAAVISSTGPEPAERENLPTA
ncbi:MAB_1171c family putative transporter [Kutzneria sp. CA-103260]|uniref:MAB_1171c family putative transporter n=1 Tax=Kutzneria sp. CA-103260 TaxID=2802641 RepID=UPI001BA82598|nr:MAB_1171c family putative transporter [Kutzneria sp. CA-103260]QUQ70187.1 hypothetical protein JJ691_79620 [Kutzneria sp. CA-103260]